MWDKTRDFRGFSVAVFFLCENRNYTFLLLQKSHLKAKISYNLLLIGLELDHLRGWSAHVDQLMSPTTGPAVVYSAGSSVPVLKWAYFWRDLLLTLALWTFCLLSSLLLSSLTASTPHYNVTHEGRGRCHRCSSQSRGRVQDSPYKEVCRVWVTGRSNPLAGLRLPLHLRPPLLAALQCTLGAVSPPLLTQWDQRVSPCSAGHILQNDRNFSISFDFVCFSFSFVCSFLCLRQCEANKQK